LELERSKIMKKIYIFGTLLFCLVLQETGWAQERFWAFYLMGTNYERTNGTATEYLDRMVEAYNSLADKNDLNGLIAMGGVDKDHWRGVRFLDLPTLAKDARDGVYGNLSAEQYIYLDETADMGAQETLSKFLRYAGQTKGDPDMSLFTMFDHGAVYYPDYAGIGPDDWTGNSLDLSAIRSSLAETGSYFDMISFDACLMGAMESARAISGYANYMLASEEVMHVDPSLLWEQVVLQLASAPDITSFGRDLIDLSTGQQYYPLGSHPTRSMVDLSQMGRIYSEAGNLGRLIAEYMADPVTGSDITLAYGLAQRYSENTRHGVDHWLSNDFYDLAQLLKTFSGVSGLKIAARNLMEAVEEFVVYSQTNGSRPQSHGVAQAPLGMDPDSAAHHARQDWMSQGWNMAVQAYAALGNQAMEAPSFSTPVSQAYLPYLGRVISGTGNGDLPDSQYAALAAQMDGEYIVDLNAVSGVMGPDGSFSVFQDQEAFVTANGWAFTPEWDGDWLSVYDAASGGFVPLPSKLIQVEEGVAEHYWISGYYTDQAGIQQAANLLIRYDLQNGSFTNQLQLYELLENGEYRTVVYGPLGAGDNFAAGTTKLDLENKTSSWGIYRNLVFQDDPQFSFTQEGEVTQMLYGVNAQGEVGYITN
jgi:hypothetical protein